MARRKTTSPGKIRSTTREANELADMLTRLLVPVLGEDIARKLAFKTLISKNPARRLDGAKEVQKYLGLAGANKLQALCAKTNFKNAR